jgi:hypothetical protein
MISDHSLLHHRQATNTVEFKHAPKGHKEEPHDRKYRRDTYWKLGFYTEKTARELKNYLAAHGYQCPRGANKAKLFEAIYRCQSGLLSYEKYSADELRAFCLARKIPSPSKEMKVPRLVHMLEEADKEPAFHRFMDLPPELRNKVCELHFRDYDEISTQRRQPPFTEVPLIRAEALPLFYKYVTFTWDLSFDTDFCIHAHTFTGNSHTLTKMPAANLAQIKNFKLYWTHIDRGAKGTTRRHVDFFAEMSQCNNVKKMDVNLGKLIEPLSMEPEDVVHLLLHEIGYWDVTWQLQRHHLIVFQDAVNEVLRASMFGK